MTAGERENETPAVGGEHQAGGDGGIWHIPLPVLPSETVSSYGNRHPPAGLTLVEEISIPSSGPAPVQELESSSPTPLSTDPSFADTANNLINEILDRTPTGNSVVDPDSVIGESLRLYHGYKDGKYLLPNDAAEQDRLDLQHELFRLMYDGWLSLAPLPKAPKYVLDIGTGTGVWAIEFAEENPSSYVIGADLSAIQPNRRIPNCEFVKVDIEDDWVFPDPNADHQNCSSGHTSSCQQNIAFDYIHLRLMFSCFDDPRTVMRQAFANLAPGGLIEYQESFFHMFQANPDFPGNALQRWQAACFRGALAFGRDLTCVPKYKQWLEEIGFVDVTEKKVLWTIGEWASDPKLRLIGRYALQNTLEGIRGIGWKMLRAAGMSAEDIEALVNQCQAELRDPRNHNYGYSYIVYGRKP
ncbi:S-adenosyl-L-methionine-dependent methyltransferase [Xylariales sp. PMI_506]|nr:S-adenosyl-L-methionine-dependent methyltransferase [Xylariales sp. PMI_506]